MNKKVSSALVTILTFAPLSASANTAGSGWAMPTISGGNKMGPTDLTTAILGVINWILGFSALIAILFIIWGGIQYLTAGGNEDQASKGRKTITNAILGLVIAGLAYAVVNAVVTGLLVSSTPAADQPAA
jgi:hypothetical protein